MEAVLAKEEFLGSITALTYAPDGLTIWAGCGPTLRIICAKTGEVVIKRQLFETGAIHGIKIVDVASDSGDIRSTTTFLCAVYGQKQLCVLSYREERERSQELSNGRQSSVFTTHRRIEKPTFLAAADGAFSRELAVEVDFKDHLDDLIWDVQFLRGACLKTKLAETESDYDSALDGNSGDGLADDSRSDEEGLCPSPLEVFRYVAVGFAHNYVEIYCLKPLGTRTLLQPNIQPELETTHGRNIVCESDAPAQGTNRKLGSVKQDLKRHLLKKVLCADRCLAYCMAFFGDSVDNLIVASGTMFQQIVIWDINGGGEPTQRLSGHEGVIFSVKWSKNGQGLISCSDDRSVRLWSALPSSTFCQRASLDEIHQLGSQTLCGLARQILDGSLPIFSGKGQVESADDGILEGVNAGEDSKVGEETVSHKLAVAAQDLNARLLGCIRNSWILSNLTTTMNSQSLSRSPFSLVSCGWGHSARLWDVGISSLGLVSTSEDATVRLWSFSGDLFAIMEGHRRKHTWKVAVEPVLGTSIASGGGDGTIKFWNLLWQVRSSSQTAGSAVIELPFAPQHRSEALGRRSNDECNEQATKMHGESLDICPPKIAGLPHGGKNESLGTALGEEEHLSQNELNVVPSNDCSQLKTASQKGQDYLQTGKGKRKVTRDKQNTDQGCGGVSAVAIFNRGCSAIVGTSGGYVLAMDMPSRVHFDNNTQSIPPLDNCGECKRSLNVGLESTDHIRWTLLHADPGKRSFPSLSICKAGRWAAAGTADGTVVIIDLWSRIVLEIVKAHPSRISSTFWFSCGENEMETPNASPNHSANACGNMDTKDPTECEPTAKSCKPAQGSALIGKLEHSDAEVGAHSRTLFTAGALGELSQWLWCATHEGGPDGQSLEHRYRLIKLCDYRADAKIPRAISSLEYDGTRRLLFAGESRGRLSVFLVPSDVQKSERKSLAGIACSSSSRVQIETEHVEIHQERRVTGDVAGSKTESTVLHQNENRGTSARKDCFDGRRDIWREQEPVFPVLSLFPHGDERITFLGMRDEAVLQSAAHDGYICEFIVVQSVSASIEGSCIAGGCHLRENGTGASQCGCRCKALPQTSGVELRLISRQPPGAITLPYRIHRSGTAKTMTAGSRQLKRQSEASQHQYQSAEKGDMLVSGFLACDFMLVDVTNEYQLIRLPGGGWKRPHALWFDEENPSAGYLYLSALPCSKKNWPALAVYRQPVDDSAYCMRPILSKHVRSAGAPGELKADDGIFEGRNDHANTLRYSYQSASVVEYHAWPPLPSILPNSGGKIATNVAWARLGSPADERLFLISSNEDNCLRLYSYEEYQSKTSKGCPTTQDRLSSRSGEPRRGTHKAQSTELVLCQVAQCHPGSVRALATLRLSDHETLVLSAGAEQSIIAWTLHASRGGKASLDMVCSLRMPNLDVNQRIHGVAIVPLTVSYLSGREGAQGTRGMVYTEDDSCKDLFVIAMGDSRGGIDLLLLDKSQGCLRNLVRLQHHRKPVLCCRHHGHAIDRSATSAEIPSESVSPVDQADKATGGNHSAFDGGLQRHWLVSGSTDGTVVVVDLTAALEVLKRRLSRCNSPHIFGEDDIGSIRAELESWVRGSRPVCQYQAHQMGVNCVSVRHIPSSLLGGRPGSFTVVTGGDDQAITLATLGVEVSHVGNIETSLLDLQTFAKASASAIKGLAIWGSCIFASGYDQRLTVWEVVDKREGSAASASDAKKNVVAKLDLQWKACRLLEVADAQDVAVCDTIDRERKVESIVAVSGSGLQICRYSC